jgi:hypothetical protein
MSLKLYAGCVIMVRSSRLTLGGSMKPSPRSEITVSCCPRPRSSVMASSSSGSLPSTPPSSAPPTRASPPSACPSSSSTRTTTAPSGPRTPSTRPATAAPATMAASPVDAGQPDAPCAQLGEDCSAVFYYPGMFCSPNADGTSYTCDVVN